MGPEFGESAGEGFADGAEFGGEDTFGCGEEDGYGLSGIGVGATSDEPVGEAGFDVFEGEVFELGDEGMEVDAHGAEHTDGEFGLAFEEGEEA